VFQITKPSDGIQLLHWNKELPSASAADPLGLNLRVSARLANELLHCITSITPRARYYSFFPWAFQDYNDRERGTKKDRGRVIGVLARERAMVLGAVLHHDGEACEGGALGGSNPASTLAEKNLKSHDLPAWKHLKAREGQFGAAYKGSLINLGVFNTDGAEVNDEAAAETDELDEATQSIEVTELSPLGKRLAESFRLAIRDTRYLNEDWDLRNVVQTDVLKEFGGRAGLCEISQKRAADRAVLRDMFFACEQESTQTGQYRRRMSLLLLLEYIGQAHDAGISFDNTCFSNISYFGAMIDEEEEADSTKIILPQSLRDIADRWRVYYSHNYLAVALQSFLVACTRALRDKPGGVARASLLNELSSSAISARFRELFDTDLPKEFLLLTPRETVAIAGINLPSGQPDFDLAPLTIDASFSERNLEGLLTENEANEGAGIALATMLFYLVVLRYPKHVSPSLNNWYLQHVLDPYTDISVPGVIGMLHAEFGEAWLDLPNREILDRVIWRFVIRQHQTMSYERGFGGSAPLFHVDGAIIVGTNIDYIDPRALNARLGSALQILTDLGMIVYDEDVGYCRTVDGDSWLKAELKREARR
jgi:hypothetical protein